MKTHELKLDIKYFDDVKSGKKNFEIRKNDRDFQVGDILELKAWTNDTEKYQTWGNGCYLSWGTMQSEMSLFQKELDEDEVVSDYFPVPVAELADTIKVKILNVVPADEYNNFQESVNGILQSIKWANSYQETYLKTIKEVLNDYFSTDRLPDGYVILGIEVVK